MLKLNSHFCGSVHGFHYYDAPEDLKDKYGHASKLPQMWNAGSNEIDFPAVMAFPGIG
jgi:hypothetical protein